MRRENPSLFINEEITDHLNDDKVSVAPGQDVVCNRLRCEGKLGYGDDTINVNCSFGKILKFPGPEIKLMPQQRPKPQQ